MACPFSNRCFFNACRFSVLLDTWRHGMWRVVRLSTVHSLTLTKKKKELHFSRAFVHSGNLVPKAGAFQVSGDRTRDALDKIKNWDKKIPISSQSSLFSSPAPPKDSVKWQREERDLVHGISGTSHASLFWPEQLLLQRGTAMKLNLP